MITVMPREPQCMVGHCKLQVMKTTGDENHQHHVQMSLAHKGTTIIAMFKSVLPEIFDKLLRTFSL